MILVNPHFHSIEIIGRPLHERHSMGDIFCARQKFSGHQTLFSIVNMLEGLEPVFASLLCFIPFLCLRSCTSHGYLNMDFHTSSLRTIFPTVAQLRSNFGYLTYSQSAASFSFNGLGRVLNNFFTWNIS